MHKYIAFNIYRRNELGGCEAAPGTSLTDSNEVYLATDVDALLREIRAEVSQGWDSLDDKKDWQALIAKINSVLMEG